MTSILEGQPHKNKAFSNQKKAHTKSTTSPHVFLLTKTSVVGRAERRVLREQASQDDLSDARSNFWRKNNCALIDVYIYI